MKAFIDEQFYENSELLLDVMNELFSNSDLVQEHDMYHDGEFLVFAVYENASKKILRKVVADFTGHLEEQIKTVDFLDDDVFDFTVLVHEYEKHFKRDIYWDEESEMFNTKLGVWVRKVS
ncbi:hypothetical protein [Flavobacterium beibuense]|uniref:hypothetical protein n=1 Tax=Flavobacterium beibuense TaxID=657326 RepID=UPI003A8D1049